MPYRLWLDDQRKKPFGYDHRAKTAGEAILFLETHEYEHCSLDHDLAEEHYEDANARSPGYGELPPPIDRSRYSVLTGFAILEWMKEKGIWVPDISIHTLNERGRDDMLAFLKMHAPEHVKYRRVHPGEI